MDLGTALTNMNIFPQLVVKRSIFGNHKTMPDKPCEIVNKNALNSMHRIFKLNHEQAEFDSVLSNSRSTIKVKGTELSNDNLSDHKFIMSM